MTSDESVASEIELRDRFEAFVKRNRGCEFTIEFENDKSFSAGAIDLNTLEKD